MRITDVALPGLGHPGSGAPWISRGEHDTLGSWTAANWQTSFAADVNA